MTGQTPEERRAELVERIARAQYAGMTSEDPGPVVSWDQQFPRNREKRLMGAEAVLALLESGEAGAYLVAGTDLQDAVGIVLVAKRRAEAEANRLRDLLEEMLIGWGNFSETGDDDWYDQVDRIRREAGLS